MASFDQVLSAQNQDVESIKRHVKYLKSLNAENCTINIIRNRCTLLENLLHMCRDRNAQLVQLAVVENKEDHNYFVDDIFGKIELQMYADLDYFSELAIKLQPTKQCSTSSHTLTDNEVYQQAGLTVNLPQINLPEFFGEFSQWQVFKDSFNSLIIENSSLNDLAKLHFLKGSLRGEAFDLICNIQTTSDNFKIAWDFLTDRYDNERAIVTAHLNAIFSLEPLKKESAAGLLQIYNTVQKNISALKNLGRPTEEYSDILVNRVIHLLDLKTQRDWELSISSTTEYPEYSDLANFLLQRIRVLEAIPNSCSNIGTAPKPSGLQSNLKDNGKFKRSNVNAHVASAKEDICVLCKQNHYLYHCPKYQEKSISDKYNFVRVRALIDPGSTWSFVSKDLVKLLNSKSIPVTATLSVLGGALAGTANSAIEIGISPVSNREPMFKTNALVIPKVTNYIPEKRLAFQTWPHLEGLNLADDPFNNDPIHLLIGAELYGALILDGIKKGNPDEPVALNTAFGWILSGNISTKQSSNDLNIQVHHCLSTKSLENSIQNFWEIEEIQKPKILSLDDEICDEHFRKTHSRTLEGQYVVRLPFTTDKPIDIGSTRPTAERSLKRLEKRFENNSELKKLYVDFMNEYQSLNHMRVVPPSNDSNNQVVYTPHHPVCRSTSQTTKVRAVFNASVLSSNGTSLKGHLKIGPKLQTYLPTVIINWRTYKFVYLADIARMYRQILIDEQDLDYQRILWRSSVDDPINEYQLLTVAYGTRSAPFLALRVLKQLTQDEGYAFPLACLVLENNIYIDDLMFGADSEHLARMIRDEVISLLRKAKFEPRKWASNCSSLISDIDPQDHGLAWTAQSPDGEGIKVLGLEWNPSNDEFQFKVQPISVDKVTKRSILSIISKLYDPVGWISPVIIVGKMLMQKLWRIDCSWDDELPKEFNSIWSEFVSSLSYLNGIKVPRWIQLAPNNIDVQMHGFSDASEVAYGAVLYLRITTSTGEVIANLLISKTKVAPIKQLSLPRLELQAAVLLARLIESVREVKSLVFHSIHCWTDSTIVLAWLKKHPSDWKTFVANRVSEIQTLLPDCTWRHISSKNNPADISSRGIRSDELIGSNLWWNGPKLLVQSENEWPTSNSDSDLQTDLEAKVHIHLVNESNSKIVMNELALRYSSWTKLLRAIAILKRFVKWLKLRFIDHKTESVKFPIMASELDSAQIFWYRYLQLIQFASEINA